MKIQSFVEHFVDGKWVPVILSIPQVNVDDSVSTRMEFYQPLSTTNSMLFTKLGGIKNMIADAWSKPRGLPDDMSNDVKSEIVLLMASEIQEYESYYTFAEVADFTPLPKDGDKVREYLYQRSFDSLQWLDLVYAVNGKGLPESLQSDDYFDPQNKNARMGADYVRLCVEHGESLDNFRVLFYFVNS